MKKLTQSHLLVLNFVVDWLQFNANLTVPLRHYRPDLRSPFLYDTNHGDSWTHPPKSKVVQFSSGSPRQRKLGSNAGCKPPSQSTPYCESKNRWDLSVESTNCGGKPDALGNDGGNNSVENRLSNIQQRMEPNELGLAWITK